MLNSKGFEHETEGLSLSSPSFFCLEGLVIIWTNNDVAGVFSTYSVSVYYITSTNCVESLELV